MKYDFDSIIDRRHSNSLKWDVAENELPMWVADMDFPTAPEIVEAVLNRAKQGVYGYTIVPNAWYEAIMHWWKKRHSLEIEKEWLCFSTGVVPIITSAVKRLTNVGDNVVLLTPVYDIFFHSVENTGRKVLESPLIYKEGWYEIDFLDLEEKLSNSLSTMLILCNPHNPAGRIWTKEELYKIGELCKKYGVIVLSDEIHCDLTEPNMDYTPFLSVSDSFMENTVMCLSATKTFSIPGLQSAAVCVPNEYLRNKIFRGLNSDEVAEPNCFAIEGTIAAFEKCGEWLDELRIYISENKKFAQEFIKKNIPEIEVTKQNATYLMWLNCSKITDNCVDLSDFIRKKTGLFLSRGDKYRGDGKYFIRLNVGCQRSRLEDGLKRLKESVIAYRKKK